MLLDFLTDTVSNMEGFKDDVQTVYVHREDEHLIATGNHPKMMLLYRVVPLVDLSQYLEAPCYLGALGYLRSLLGSPLLKGANLFVEYQEREGKKTFAKSIRFISGRVDANFECTNPDNIKEKEVRTQFEKFKDAVIFPFTKEMRKEFDEYARMGTPKADARIFNLVYDGKYIRAVFGSGTHTTTLILTDQVSGNTETKIQKLVSLDRFRPMIKLAAENTGKASFHERAVWVDFQTEHSQHTIVTPTLRDQTR